MEHTGVRNGVGARGWLEIPVSDDTTSTAHRRARRKRTMLDTAASLSFATYRNRKKLEAEMLHLGGPDAFASRGDEHSRFAHGSQASSASSQRASLPGLEECSQVDTSILHTRRAQCAQKSIRRNLGKKMWVCLKLKVHAAKKSGPCLGSGAAAQNKVSEAFRE